MLFITIIRRGVCFKARGGFLEPEATQIPLEVIMKMEGTLQQNIFEKIQDILEASL